MVSKGARWAGGREGVLVWGPALSADLRVVPGVLPGVGKSPLHSEVSVGVLGVSSNGWVCHPLFIMILTRTKMEHVRRIWLRGVDQDLPNHLPKMSIEQLRTFNRFLVCSWQGGGIQRPGKRPERLEEPLGVGKQLQKVQLRRDQCGGHGG
jgi:hypothetical protein